MVNSYSDKSFTLKSYSLFGPFTYMSSREIVGFSYSVKPTTNTLVGTRFYETNTFGEFIWNGASWDRYENVAQTYTNKTIDVELNRFPNSLLSSEFGFGAGKTGAIIPACDAVNSLIDCIDGMTVNGDGTPTWVIDAAEGPVLKFTRAATGIMGYTSTSASDSILTRRALNPILKIRFRIDSISSSRLYIGFTSATALPNTDTPLATGDSGVIFGFRTTDSNFSVINNDGSGAEVVTSTGVVKDATTYHTVSFTFSASNVVVVLDDGAGAKTQTITTRIPATTTDLKLSVMAAY